MNRLAVLPAALCLMAFRCGNDEQPAVTFPVLPDLPAEVLIPCPPLPAVTGTLGDLVTKDAAAALEYARCRARAATAVGAYRDAQSALRAADARENEASGSTGASER